MNVHPAKTQVRFVNEEALLDILIKAIKAVMSEMNFEDESASWRDRVVDQGALQKNHSSAAPSESVADPERTNTEKRVNAEAEALEEHRARIQERLRRRLHGEEVDLEALASSTRVPSADHRSKPSKVAGLPSSPRETSSNPKPNNSESSNRHEVTRITQDELRSWRKGALTSSNLSADGHIDSHRDGEEDSTSESVGERAPEPKHEEMAESSLSHLSHLSDLLTSDLDHSEHRRAALPSLKALHDPLARQALRVVGRADEWWIQEASDGLLMIHLPSARTHAVTDKPQPVQLSTAIQLTLTPSEIKELSQHQEQLLTLGVTLEPFGGQVYRLVTLPRGLELSPTQRIAAALSDLLSSRTEQLTVSWAKCILSLPLTTEGRTFTLQWLNDGGAPDPSLPPFMVTLNSQELLRRCGHLSPF